MPLFTARRERLSGGRDHRDRDRPARDNGAAGSDVGTTGR
jgi:hypothetical protein